MLVPIAFGRASAKLRMAGDPGANQANRFTPCHCTSTNPLQVNPRVGEQWHFTKQASREMVAYSHSNPGSVSCHQLAFVTTNHWAAGSIPFALITAFAAGVARNSISALAPAKSFELATTAAENRNVS